MEKITLAKWEELPWLLSRKQVMLVVGVDNRELTKLQEAGVLHRHRAGRGGKYFKAEIGKMCRLPM